MRDVQLHYSVLKQLVISCGIRDTLSLFIQWRAPSGQYPRLMHYFLIPQYPGGV